MPGQFFQAPSLSRLALNSRLLFAQSSQVVYRSAFLDAIIGLASFQLAVDLGMEGLAEKLPGLGGRNEKEKGKRRRRRQYT